MTDRPAIVTGGAGGLGRAIAASLAADGWPVALVDICETVHDVAESLNVRAHRCDLTDRSARIGMLQEVGIPGALINSAGFARLSPLLAQDEEHWRQTLEINLTVPFLLSQEVARVMAPHGGSIVNIASVSGIRAGVGRAAYGTSKAGVIHLTRQMAVELAPHGIRCNAIAPGPVAGPLTDESHPSEQVAEYLKTIPQARYAQPEEVASVATFLCSQAAAHVTGQCLPVDGGWTAGGVGIAALHHSI